VTDFCLVEEFAYCRKSAVAKLLARLDGIGRLIDLSGMGRNFPFLNQLPRSR
jgi:hypothetical protein